MADTPNTEIIHVIPMSVIEWCAHRDESYMEDFKNAVGTSPEDAKQTLGQMAADLGLTYEELNELATVRYDTHKRGVTDSRCSPNDPFVDSIEYPNAEEALNDLFWVLWAIQAGVEIPWDLVLEYMGDMDKGIVDINCCMD